MPNAENLIPFTSDQDREQAKINGRKGGKARQKQLREQKALKNLLQDILKMPLKEGDIQKIKNLAEFKGANITVEQALLLAQVKRALKGDLNSFKVVIEIAELLKQEEESEKAKDNSFINALNKSAEEVWKDEK